MKKMHLQNKSRKNRKTNTKKSIGLIRKYKINSQKRVRVREVRAAKKIKL